MASEITCGGDEWIQFLSSFPPQNLRQDLEDNHFDNNSEYDEDFVNAILIMLITIVRGFFLFDKSSYEERWEMSCDEYPVQTRKNPGKGGRKINNNNNLCLNR